MSKKMKRNLAGGSILTALLAFLAITMVAGPFASRGDTPAPREIVLEARELAFGGDNPTLHARPGERIRLTVRNTEPGVLHAITIPGIDSQVRHVKYGEQVSFEITMPQGGSYEYICPQPAPKMRGRIVVTAEP